MRFVRHALVALVALVVLPATRAVLAETHRFVPEVGHHTYAVREPVLTIEPGDILDTETLDGDYFRLLDGAWPGEVGPIYIEGATPDDTLVIEILELRPRLDIGRSGTSSSYGVLTQTDRHPMLHEPVPRKMYLWSIDREKMTGTLELPNSRLKKIEVPLHPMLGRVATAPAGDQAISGGTPYDFGGNLDAPEVREGTTVYLPIFHDGAYFYFGDGHARQGDGEIAGSGIETAMTVKLRLGLIKGRKIAWPRFEDAEFLMVAGSVRPLIDAYRIAHVELIHWLEDEYGFDRWEALQVVSQIGTARIANVVDPNYTIVAKFPKKFLPR